MKKALRQSEADPLECLLLGSPFLVGLFFPWGSTLAVLFLTVLLAAELKKGRILIAKGPLLPACCSLVLFLTGGCLWGTDRGMALLGVLQFLPLPLFVLALEQREPAARLQLTAHMPAAAAVMVLLSLLLSCIPAWKDWFLVNGRLAGFFQYPNSFALYLLTALIVLLHFGPYPQKEKALLSVILCGGIILSGSRTAGALLISVMIISGCRAETRRSRRNCLLAALLILATGLYLVFAGSRSLSTFYGRLLYARDALPVILHHPLGLGYNGFYWLQGSFQTGVYSVRHVHNEFLQLLLDAGWFPAALFLWALIRSFRAKDGHFGRKLMMAVICLHSLFDFDMQFTALAFLLLTATDTEPGVPYRVTGRLSAGIAALTILFSLWLGTASFLLYTKRPQVALKLYPAYTAALLDLLPETENNRAEAAADRILRLNSSAAPAWDVKAKATFQRQADEEALAAKEEALRLSPYNLREYQEYLALLDQIRLRRLSRGDAAGAARCRAKAEEVPALIKSAEERISSLGRRIQDQPNLDISLLHIGSA